MAEIMIWPFIILQIATVVAIVLFLRMILHKQMEVGLNRIKRIDKGNIDKEAELNDGLEKLKKEYTDKMKYAEDQAALLINAAKETVKEMRSAERIEAKEEAKKIIKAALEEKEKTLREVERQIHVKAIELSEKILKRVFSEQELAALKRGIIREVVEVLFNSDTVSAFIQKNENIEVITAEKLTRIDREYILKLMKKQSRNKKEPVFVVDKAILGGIVLRSGESRIDGSIVYRLTKAIMEEKEAS
ncbi:MAG: F0F1 ATP synthase subunit delta [Candidatus Omnitrophota bacterium]